MFVYRPKPAKKSRDVSPYAFIHFPNVHTLDTKHRLLTRKTKSQVKFKKEVQWFFVMFCDKKNITKNYCCPIKLLEGR